MPNSNKAPLSVVETPVLQTRWGKRLRALGTLTAAVELLYKGSDIEAPFNAERALQMRQAATLLLEMAEEMAHDAAELGRRG